MPVGRGMIDKLDMRHDPTTDDPYLALGQLIRLHRQWHRNCCIMIQCTVQLRDQRQEPIDIEISYDHKHRARWNIVSLEVLAQICMIDRLKIMGRTNHPMPVGMGLESRRADSIV